MVKFASPGDGNQATIAAAQARQLRVGFTNRQFIKTMPVKLKMDRDCIGLWQRHCKKFTRLTPSKR